MKLTLIRFLLALLLPLVWLPGSAQTPQNSDCNVCNCAAVGGASLTTPIAAPACPGGSITGQFPAGASTNRRFATAIGNRYRARVCGTTLNTVLYIRNAGTPYTVLAGACDDDGCGTPGGPSSVEFIAAATEYRAYIYDGGTSCAAFATHGIIDLEITCLGSATPPANDEPCNAEPLSITGLTSCTAPIAGSTDAATPTTLAGLGTTPLLPNYSALPTPSGCPNGMAVNYAGGDVWYSVTVPSSGLIGIEVNESGVCALAMGLYTTPDCSAGPYSWVGGGPIGLCTNDGLSGPNQAPGIVFNPASYGLTAGQTVYIRVWERNNNENGNFTICAYNAQPPVNDDPCGAITLTPGDPCVPQEYNTINAQPLPPGLTVAPMTCGPPVGLPATSNPLVRDVWFRVIVPPTGNMTVTTFAGTLSDMAMQWYRRSPPSPPPHLPGGSVCIPYSASLVAITGPGCNDNQSASNLMPRINSTTGGIALTAGEEIFIRVWNRSAAQYTYHGTFSICVTPNTPPPNDDPCGAIALELTADCIQIPSTVENATNTLTPFAPGASTVAVPSCGGAANGDVWFTVDVPLDLIAPYGIRIDTDAPTPLDLAMAVYRDNSGTGCPTQLQLVQVTPVAGSCAVGGTAIGSPINASMPGMLLTVPTITPGERLFVRVWRQTTAQGPFTICARRTDPLVCQGTVYDSGGPNGQYANSETWTQTYCAAKLGDVVTLTFSQFNIENNWDFFSVYDAPSVLPANLIGTFTGTNGPGTISASISVANPQGCLTVRFTSDGIITAPGFAFKVSCAPPPVPVAGSCNVISYTPGMTVHTGGTNSYDPGGPTGTTYPGNLGVGSTGVAPFHARYCPSSAGNVVTMNFSSFNVEATFDGLYVFDADILPGTPLNTGPITASQFNSGNGPQATWSGAYNPPTPPNGAFWGGNSPGTITATNATGCITLVFYTDGIVSGSGWAAQVTCGPPPPPPPPPVGQCNIFVYETPPPAGATGNYGNNVSSTQTFCANAGQLLTVTFDQFQVENQWDKLYVFDGPTTASPMIPSGNGPGLGPAPFGAGGYWGNALPGPFTSSSVGPSPNGCLTFHFVTDPSVTFPGFRARTSCVTQAPNDNPCTPTGATLITPNPICNLQSYTNAGTTNTPGVPAPGCGNYAGGDVWFRFVAPPSGRVYIDTRAGTLTDAAMALYSTPSPACAGPFTLLECDDDDGPGLMPAIDRMCNTLTPGSTYWLRVYGYNGARGTFELCIVEGTMNSTMQNDCGGAFSLCNNAPVTGIAYGNGCGPDITATNWGCLTGGERQGSWYAFRTNVAGTLGMTITPSGPADVDWAIWQGTLVGAPNPVGASCQPAGAPIRCSFASQLNTFNSGGAGGNPTYATGMGRNTWVGGPVAASPNLPVINDAVDGWMPGITVAANQMYLLFVDDHHLNGLPYQVTWQESAGGLMGCEILPVEALQLQAQAQTHAVDLLWSTTREQNTSHFILERALDGVHFVPFGRTEAVGNAAGLTEYRSVDDGPQVGLNYYRVQLVDVDGAVTLSNVVTALFQPKAVSVMVVPNPTRDQAELLLSAAHEGDLFVRITDGSGRLVASFLAPTGLQRMQLPIAHLEGGSYTVQLVTEKGEPHARTRFVKH